MAELPETDTIGARIRERRQELKLSLSQLAERAQVSKSYLWNLENKPEHKRPSGDTLYALAEALGTTMSDLMNRRLLTDPEPDIDPVLAAYAKQARISRDEVRMLASIQWRGDRPQSIKRWRFVHEALQASRVHDE